MCYCCLDRLLVTHLLHSGGELAGSHRLGTQTTTLVRVNGKVFSLSSLALWTMHSSISSPNQLVQHTNTTSSSVTPTLKAFAAKVSAFFWEHRSKYPFYIQLTLNCFEKYSDYRIHFGIACVASAVLVYGWISCIVALAKDVRGLIQIVLYLKVCFPICPRYRC